MAGELTHLGFIADGNRRWARSHGLPTLEGHRRGFDCVDELIDTLKDTEVKYVSFFVFSTENWDRSQEEIDYLMDLIGKKITSLTKKAQKNNLRIILMGRPDPVDPKLWQRLLDAEAETKDNTGLNVIFCFNYGGLWEIADAANKAIHDALESREEDGVTISSDDFINLTPDDFAKYLYHPEVPPLDMVVRTSGEQRLSGFHLWRSAYAELWFIEKNFPDITGEDALAAIEEFHQRHRRFGK